MYWKTHATEVYIKGEYYDHAGGEKAPAPTVMYTGARSHATNYVRPKLEDLKPYRKMLGECIWQMGRWKADHTNG